MASLGRRDFLRLAGAGSIALTADKAVSLPGPEQQSINPADPWIEVDRANLQWNLAQIRRRVENRPVMAVIKANAYGHGLEATAKSLADKNVAFLAVAKLDEALRLRQSGIGTGILNFGGFSAGEADAIVRHDISQSIYTDHFAHLASAAQKLNRQARVHIKLDTGLGRVGIPHRHALPLIEKIAENRAIRIEGIFSPLTEDDHFDQIQLRRFHDICDQAKKRGISVGRRHAASSAGILSFPDAHLDMVRPGIAVYGEYPSTREYEAKKIPLRPALSLKTRIAYVKTLRPGDSISYHRNFVAERETRVATLPIGYSDGYPHTAAGKARVLIGGRRFPSIALITSNHMTIDITEGGPIQAGEEAVLLGAQGSDRITGEELAAWAGTSVYKILIQMSPLLPRIFI